MTRSHPKTYILPAIAAFGLRLCCSLLTYLNSVYSSLASRLGWDQLKGYKASLRAKLDDLKQQLSCSKILGSVLDSSWISRVAAQIDGMQTDLRYNDAAYYLFSYDFRVMPLSINEIEEGLVLIESRAQTKNSRQSFEQTRSRFAIQDIKQLNQIDAAIFEVLLLRALILRAVSTGIQIELYPLIGKGGSNIEARLRIDSQWCNVEAKALGYTKYDVGAGGKCVGVHSIDSMITQVSDVLKEKADEGKQLACVPDGESAILSLALKANADTTSGPWAIKKFFESHSRTPLSAVVLFSSAFCRTPTSLYSSVEARCPLTEQESKFFKTLVL